MKEYNKIIYILPENVKNELLKLAGTRCAGEAEITEIRLRVFGKSCFKIDGELIELCSEISRIDMERTFKAVSGGAVYMHRETIKDGYISCSDGIRVGVCGEARYDSGELIGISNIASLIFRIPPKKKYEVSEIFRAWENTERGLLIYSPPGLGKTTALRALAGYIGGSLKKQLAIVDTRREFRKEDYRFSHVDILSGYRRAEGLETALRCLSPDVVMVDEIGGKGESEAMLEFLNSGVKIAASAHAGSISELKKRKSLSGFFDNEIFDSLVGIYADGGRRSFKLGRI